MAASSPSSIESSVARPNAEPGETSSRALGWDDFFSARSRRQLALFLAGASFLALSTAITRRSLARRYKFVMPAFYHPNNRSLAPISGVNEALEALNIATINILSLSLMTTGGMLWAFDISSLEEFRTKVRGGMGVTGASQDADEEIEEWVASVLARKDEKERKGSKPGRN